MMEKGSLIDIFANAIVDLKTLDNEYSLGTSNIFDNVIVIISSSFPNRWLKRSLRYELGWPAK